MALYTRSDSFGEGCFGMTSMDSGSMGSINYFGMSCPATQTVLAWTVLA